MRAAALGERKLPSKPDSERESPVSEMPQWFSTDSAAAYIGVTAATLRWLVAGGEVPAFQIGRVRRYRRSDLNAFLESARVTPPTVMSRLKQHLGASGPGRLTSACPVPEPEPRDRPGHQPVHARPAYGLTSG